MGIKVCIESEIDFARAKKIAIRLSSIVHKDSEYSMITALAATQLLFEAMHDGFVEEFGQDEYDRIYKDKTTFQSNIFLKLQLKEGVNFISGIFEHIENCDCKYCNWTNKSNQLLTVGEKDGTSTN